MRNTAANKKILELLNNSNQALSQSDIQALLPENFCDRVTIYRVLDRLVDEGLAHKVVNLDGVICYANCQNCTNNHHHNHLHFNCEKCNTITCLEDVEPTFSLPTDYQMNKTSFVVSGLCPKCLQA